MGAADARKVLDEALTVTAVKVARDTSIESYAWSFGYLTQCVVEALRHLDTLEAGGPRCESCGDVAEVTLDDGSTWCADCDAAARKLGYDDGTAA